MIDAGATDVQNPRVATPHRRLLAVTPEQFGAVLDKDGPLTACVSGAVDALRADGTLDTLEQEWLASAGATPDLR